MSDEDEPQGQGFEGKVFCFFLQQIFRLSALCYIYRYNYQNRLILYRLNYLKPQNYWSMFNKGYFTVPSSWLHTNLERGNEKAVIISVIGQSPIDANGYKTSPLELMLGKNIFRRNMVQPISFNEELMTGIQGFYDPDRRVVFLHLIGCLDTSCLLKTLNKLNNELQEKGFLIVWSNLKLQYARSLLLLFCISHILLLCHPNHIFDITYIHLFRTLDIVRSKFQHAASSILKCIPGVTKDWHSNGRICSPRVLFLFSSRLIPLHVLNGANGEFIKPTGKVDRNLASPLRKLELDLEYQIYRLLRKSRVITNISANSLFALPNNQPFVYIMEEEQEALISTNLLTNTLDDLCNPVNSLAHSFSSMMYHSSAANGDHKDPSQVSLLSSPVEADSLSQNLLSTVSAERKRNLEHSFNQFLKQHIDEALTRGFDDSVGRHTTPIFFEVPKVSVWFETFHALYKYFVENLKDSEDKENQIVSSLRASLETDIKFSDARCSKVLPLAVSSYKDGLPSHYTHAHHQSKLDMAMGILASQARGPMYEKYVAQLEEKCESIWKDGRIGCETLSLTGNTCHHPRHQTDKDSDTTLPVMNHSSGALYINYCNCGHHQVQMEDPFTVKAANYDVFEKLSETMCGILEYHNFPTFKSSVVDARAAEVDMKSHTMWPDNSESVLTKDNKTADTDTPQSPMELSMESAGLSQRNSSNPSHLLEEGVQDGEVIYTVAKEEGENDDGKADDDGYDHDLGRQISTTEYLPGMLTSSSPMGLLPQFSSWSLVCLGPSSLYSHNAGICDQPGFVSGTNFLLPWDVTIKIRDKDKWPAIADSMGKKGFLLKNKKNRMGGDLSEFSVKIFLGAEYQCLRGHRFMMAAPDRHLKASNIGHVKDTAVKISNSDMPLYFPCPCSRSSSVVNGQLMRIHVVTPKAPVHVTLNPQVQPAPDPCPRFIPQPMSHQTIKLSASAYYILRLPLVYVGDSGPYYPPNARQTPSSYARLIKGCYGISEITLDR